MLSKYRERTYKVYHSCFVLASPMPSSVIRTSAIRAESRILYYLVCGVSTISDVFKYVHASRAFLLTLGSVTGPFHLLRLYHSTLLRRLIRMVVITCRKILIVYVRGSVRSNSPPCWLARTTRLEIHISTVWLRDLVYLELWCLAPLPIVSQ